MAGYMLLSVFILGITIIVFILIRQIVLWYFRINEIANIISQNLEVNRQILSYLTNSTTRLDQSMSSSNNINTDQSISYENKISEKFNDVNDPAVLKAIIEKAKE